jgi:hypothetical protein
MVWKEAVIAYFKVRIASVHSYSNLGPADYKAGNYLSMYLAPV